MQALENLKVLDLTRIGPGPLCTMLLGDMGAEVLRVQAPEQVSQQARLHRLDVEDDQRSLAYYAMGRNKRSLALDLKNADARSIFHQLARTADVVIEGFRPGVVKRLGVSYEQLRELNPRLVYCSLSGYGQTGPYAGLPGHDINYIAMAGALSLFGGADGRPSIPLNLVADYGGGAMMAAFGILCALRARDLTGVGQLVDISMMDGVLHLLTREVSSHLETGEMPRRGEHRLGGGRMEYNVYECSDGKWITVGSGEPWFYANLCKAIGREDFLPLQQAGPDEHRRMIGATQAIFRTKPRDEWVDLLMAQEQCVAPVLELDELEHHPQVRAREMVLEVVHPELGPIKQPGFGVKLSETPASLRRFAPRTGEHTDEVLAGLNYTPDRIAELRASGAIG